MERCVALLILAALVCTAGHEQLHNLHMACGQHKQGESISILHLNMTFIINKYGH